MFNALPGNSAVSHCRARYRDTAGLLDVEADELESPPNALDIASDISVKTELGKFKIEAIKLFPTKLPMYAGIGNTTSNLDGFASPSLALMFDRNKLGENDIRISF